MNMSLLIFFRVINTQLQGVAHKEKHLIYTLVNILQSKLVRGDNYAIG